MVREPVGHEAGPDELDVEPHPEQGPLADGHVAVLGAFAAADEHRAPLEVDVSGPERDELAAAQAAGVEDLQHGPIPQAEGRVTSGASSRAAISAALRVASGRRRSGRGMRRSAAGLVVDPVLTAQPGEELGDGDEALGLGAERQRLAVALAVGEKLVLIGQQELEASPPWRRRSHGPRRRR